MIVSNWETISSLATAAGTLVLAVVTVWSLRSANRAARVAEAALIDQRRRVLVTSRIDDPRQKIMFVDQRWVSVEGGFAAAQHVDGVIYLVVSLRNVGAGIAVMRAWAARPGILTSAVDPVPLEELRAQSRDLYVPAGDVGLWQGALRDPDDHAHASIADAIAAREPISIDMLYSDHIGDQRAIVRVNLVPVPGHDDKERWLANSGRHWDLGRLDPRHNHQNGSRLQPSWKAGRMSYLGPVLGYSRPSCRRRRRSRCMSRSHRVVAAAWYSAVACAFSLAPVISRYRQAKKWIDRVTGGVLTGLAVRLATER